MALPKTPLRPTFRPAPLSPLRGISAPPAAQLWRRPGVLAVQASLAAAGVALAAAAIATALLARRRRVEAGTGAGRDQKVKRVRFAVGLEDWKSGALWKREAERRLHEGYTSFLYACL
jgi:hypothetical protein